MPDRPATSYKTLREFRADVRRFDPEAFEQEYGEAFLVHHGPMGTFEMEPGLKDTRVTDSKQEGTEGFDPGEDFLVFAVRRTRPPTPDDDLIWLGRSEDNDVVVPDATVSAIHAFFTRLPEGEYAVQDMNSMNGTELNGRPVPGQGMGPPVKLYTGSRLLLGNVSMTFLRADDLHALVQRLLD